MAQNRIKELRELRGLTLEQLAEATGLSTSYVQRLENGERNLAVKHFDKFAAALGVSSRELIAQDDAAAAGRVDTIAPVLIPRDQLQAPGVPDFRIFASAEGGPGQIILSTEPVDFQPRPTILQNVRDAYGLIIAGDSMSPEYRNGDTALINPHLPPVGGEVYVFYSENDGEARATIKHLRRATPDKWLVSQHNPPPNMPKDFTLSRAEWRVAHRVLGKYARR